MKLHRKWYSLIAMAFMTIPACTAQTTTPQEDTVPWDEALRILNTGEVIGVSQTHDLWVRFERKDGRWFWSKGPGIDVIFDEIENCKSCGGLYIITE